MRLKKGFAPIAVLFAAVAVIAVFASVKLFAQQAPDNRPVEGVIDRICRINPFKCKPTPSPIPRPAAISWVTPYASIEADEMIILVGRKLFTGQGKITRLDSDPGNATYQTLEIEWTENNTPMRLFIYFSADGQRWKVTELRTYNGQNPGGWIYYPGFEGNSLGQPFEKESFKLKGDSGTGALTKIDGTLRFKNIKLQAFKTPTGCYQNPILTLNPTSVAPGQTVDAKITRPEDCKGTNVTSIWSSTNENIKVAQCSFLSGSRTCMTSFTAKTTPGQYSYSAGLDIDDNGTPDTWSGLVSLVVLNTPQSPTPSAVPILNPVISSITPPNVGPYSGDIKITGINFGSAKGKVYFTQNGVVVGGSMIRSWSNNVVDACNISVPSPNSSYGARVETADGRVSTDFPYYVGPSQSIGTPLPCNF